MAAAIDTIQLLTYSEISEDLRTSLGLVGLVGASQGASYAVGF